MKQYIKYINKSGQSGGGNDITINFYFVRHAYSCANLKSTEAEQTNIINKIIANIQQISEKDPNLTNYGIDHSKKIGQEIKDKNIIGYIDFLFSSSLVRAMETAYLMFIHNNFKFNNTNEIIIAPFLREKGSTSENIPFDAKEQYDKRIKLLGIDIPIKRITENNVIRGYLDDKDGYDGNLFKFMEWFLNTYHYYIKSKQLINVIIVTHSNLMQHDFHDYNIIKGEEIKSFKERKPHNNSIYQYTIKLPNVTSDKKTFMLNKEKKTLGIINEFMINNNLIEIHNGIEKPSFLPNQYCEQNCTFYKAIKCPIHKNK